MEGIPEKDMEERRRMLEQKNQGINTMIVSASVSATCLTLLILIFRDSEEEAEPG